MDKTDYIYGIETRLFKGNRLFKIYFSQDSIVGAKIAGQVYDLDSMDALFGSSLLVFIGKPFVPRLIEKRFNKEIYYDSIDFFDASIVEHDSNNFFYSASEIHCIEFHAINHSESKIWRIENHGSLVIHFFDGSNRKFILPVEQSYQDALEALSNTDIPVEHAEPVICHKTESRHLAYLWLLWFSVLSTVLGVYGMTVTGVQDLYGFGLSMIFLGLGVGLFLAWINIDRFE